MEKKANPEFYRMNIRIDNNLASRLKDRSLKERTSINFLISSLLEKGLQEQDTSNLKLKVDENILKTIKSDADKVGLKLEEYIILKLLS